MKFHISLKEKPLTNSIPTTHSNVWARSGNKIVCFGGRADGFHGLVAMKKPFKSSEANDMIFVINLDDFSFQSMKLSASSEYYLQMTSTNAQFCQSGDSLYVVGGFGRSSLQSEQSDTTFNKMIVFSISQLINQVESNGNVDTAVLNTITDDYLQVTGGKLKYVNGVFYLMFGQNFYTDYKIGITGDYTNAIRKFSISGNTLTGKSTLQYPFLHRRDLNVELVYGSDGLIAAYGGVFTKANNGYPTPVKITANTQTFTCEELSAVQQTSNHYDCAVVSVYDAVSQTNAHALLGGIGKNQFREQSLSWENGDLGALLPFVHCVTIMSWNAGQLTQEVQTAPDAPMLPALIGANAMFFPLQDYMIENNVVDYCRIPSGTSSIGYFYGGIYSYLPTSSLIYPTSVNDTLYEVQLTKLD